jgi:PST family polysaccharide transporter
LKLLKTTFFSGIITAIRISSNFVAGKIVAILTGAGGVAVIGAFANFLTIVFTLANGAINNGVIKYTADYADDKIKLKKLFSTSLAISAVCSLIVGAFLLIFGKVFAIWIFTTSSYQNQIRVLGLTIIFYSINSLLIAILNGKNQIRTYTIVNTIGSIVGLLFTSILVYFYKISGALYALVLAQSIVFIVTCILIAKSEWFKWDYFRQPVDKNIIKKLGSFSLMAVISAITVPVSQIVLRNMIIHKFNINYAGYWQGVMRVSDGYLLLMTTSLSTYFLPKFSSIKDRFNLKKELFNGFKFILPLVLVGCVIIYCLRFYIIIILYSDKFVNMEPLFLYQLVGDFFKMASWILGYLMLSKAMTKIYIVTEIFSTCSYIVLGYLLVNVFGLRGITMAFALNYFLYLLMMVYVFRKLLFNFIKD